MTKKFARCEHWSSGCEYDMFLFVQILWLMDLKKKCTEINYRLSVYCIGIEFHIYMYGPVCMAKSKLLSSSADLVALCCFVSFFTLHCVGWSILHKNRIIRSDAQCTDSCIDNNKKKRTLHWIYCANENAFYPIRIFTVGIWRKCMSTKKKSAESMVKMFRTNFNQVEGTLSVQPQANPVVGFEEHFLSLTVENNERNPWFVGKWAWTHIHGIFIIFLLFHTE